jgi:hypothetical protein
MAQKCCFLRRRRGVPSAVHAPKQALTGGSDTRTKVRSDIGYLISVSWRYFHSLTAGPSAAVAAPACLSSPPIASHSNVFLFLEPVSVRLIPGTCCRERNCSVDATKFWFSLRKPHPVSVEVIKETLETLYTKYLRRPDDYHELIERHGTRR